MQFENIFIVGTGRSGTHFLCRTLRDFEKIEDYMNGEENHPVRVSLTISALQHRALTTEVIEHYKKYTLMAKNDDKIFLDQLHTNLFHVDQLIELFPQSLFLCTDRPTEQIVSSMLKHKGVLGWFDMALRDDSFVYPNQFMGVDSTKQIKSTPTHLLCVKRIEAHNQHREYLLKKYPDNVRRVLFQELIQDQHRHLASVFTKDELSRFGKYTQNEKADSSVLEKYKQNLNSTILDDIKNAGV